MILNTVDAASPTACAMLRIDWPSRCRLSTSGVNLARFLDVPGSRPRRLPFALARANPALISARMSLRTNP